MSLVDSDCTDYKEILSYEQTITGHKVHDAIDSPFTVSVLLPICDAIVDPANNIGITPNDVTIFRFILCLFAIYLIIKGYTKWAAFFYLTAYMLDCLDGILARKHDQSTILGDNLDHFADIFSMLGIFTIIMIRYPMNKWWLLLLGISIFGTITHLGLTEEMTSQCLGLDQPDNFLRKCMIISNWFNPANKNTTASSPQNLATSDQYQDLYCKNLVTTMKWTRWNTDINIILVISIYLFTRS